MWFVSEYCGFNCASRSFVMSLSTVLFAVVMVGVAGLIIFDAVKSISEEFNFEIPSIGLPKLALPKFSSSKASVSTQKASFRHNFWDTAFQARQSSARHDVFLLHHPVKIAGVFIWPSALAFCQVELAYCWKFALVGQHQMQHGPYSERPMARFGRRCYSTNSSVLAWVDRLMKGVSVSQISPAPSIFWLIAVGILFTCASGARSDEWVSCKRDGSTGQLVWMRGKSTQLLKNAEFQPGATNPDVGQCLVTNDQLRKAHGLKFWSPVCLPILPVMLTAASEFELNPS